jgi:hypothetical protein
MKPLILFLILAFSAQPLQAGICDMETGQDAPHPMEHADNGGHDCCDSDQNEPQQECDSEMQCGFYSASVSILPNILKISANWEIHFSPDLSSGFVLPSHSSPPFRPPIS